MKQNVNKSQADKKLFSYKTLQKIQVLILLFLWVIFVSIYISFLDIKWSKRLCYYFEFVYFCLKVVVFIFITVYLYPKPNIICIFFCYKSTIIFQNLFLSSVFQNNYIYIFFDKRSNINSLFWAIAHEELFSPCLLEWNPSNIVFRFVRLGTPTT